VKRNKVDLTFDPINDLIKYHMNGPEDMERQLAPDMQLIYNNHTIYDIIREGNLRYSATMYSLLEDISTEVLVSTYCAPGYGFMFDKVTSQYERLGLDVLTSTKLYNMFEKTRKSILENKNNKKSSTIYKPPLKNVTITQESSECSSMTPIRFEEFEDVMNAVASLPKNYHTPHSI
jgi:hypothetical protein